MRGTWKEMYDVKTLAVLAVVFGFLGYFVGGTVGLVALTALTIALLMLHFKSADTDGGSCHRVDLRRRSVADYGPNRRRDAFDPAEGSHKWC